MTETIDLELAEDGRLVLPPSVRRALDLLDGDRLLATVENGEVRLTPLRRKALEVQEIYARRAASPRTVDQFLKDRREEGR